MVRVFRLLLPYQTLGRSDCSTLSCFAVYGSEYPISWSRLNIFALFSSFFTWSYQIHEQQFPLPRYCGIDGLQCHNTRVKSRSMIIRFSKISSSTSPVFTFMCWAEGFTFVVMDAPRSRSFELSAPFSETHSLSHHHTPLSFGREFRWRKFHQQKSNPNTNVFAGPNIQCSHCTSTWPSEQQLPDWFLRHLLRVAPSTSGTSQQ